MQNIFIYPWYTVITRHTVDIAYHTSQTNMIVFQSNVQQKKREKSTDGLEIKRRNTQCKWHYDSN